MESIYLDNNSTTAMLPEVADVVHEAARAGYANPSSQHRLGQQARRLLEDARERIAESLGTKIGGKDGDRLIFTSGGTESNNLAIRGLTAGHPGNVILSAIEHPSILGMRSLLEQQGHEVRLLPACPTGTVQVDALPNFMNEDTRLISVMLGNHETGCLQPVQEVVRVAATLGTPVVHTDAVQAVGKIRVSFRELGVAALSFSAHKFHGPPGIGGLLLRQGTIARPILFGGHQQEGLRPGTEPLPLVLGMSKALELWQRDRRLREDRLCRLRDSLERLLRHKIPSLIVNGQATARLPHTLNVAFPGIDRQALLMALDFADVACSTGSACASGSSEPSPVLLAMGLPETIVESSIRFSLSVLNTDSQIDAAVDRIFKVYRSLERPMRS